MSWRSWHERLYRVVLLLFPPRFRRTYRDEMAAVFRHRWQRAAFPRAPRVWTLSLFDAARVLPYEWVAAAKESWREMKATNWMAATSSFLSDVRFSVRSLVRKPGHLTVATVSLALGIGFNIVIFAVINGLMLRPLPFNGADRLAYIVKRHVREGWITSPDREVVRALSENEGLFEAVEPYSSSSLTLLGGVEPRVVSTLEVSETFMPAFGIIPLLGRGFRLGDAAETERAVVLSESLWRGAFGEDPGIVGTEVNLGGEAYTVLGVVASEFNLGMTGTPDAWRLRNEDSGQTGVLARLTPGTTVEAATAGAAAIANGLEEAGSLPREEWTEMVVPPLTFLGKDFANVLWTLLAAVGVLLLIACSNLANMTLAKGLGRSQELGVRRALGASRFRVVRLFMIESLLLSLFGGVIGLVLAHWGLDIVRRLRPAYISALDFVTIGPRIWVAAIVVSILAALIFGLLPTLRLAGIDYNPALRAGSRFSSGTAVDRRARRILVAVEVALALPLTIAAGLMARTVYQATHQDFGVDVDGFVSGLVMLSEDAYGDEETRTAFWSELQRQLEAAPIVDEVLITSFAPPHFSIAFGEPEVEGRELSGTPQGMVSQIPTPAGYFHLAGTQLLLGRTFTEGDADENVVIVSETFARRLGYDVDPVGTRIRFSRRSEDWYTVIGVAENVVGSAASSRSDQIQVYLPTTGHRGFLGRILIRTDAPLEAVLPLLKDRIWSIDPTVPLRDLAEVRKSFMDIFGRQRFAAILFATFGAVGLLLAAAGIHGVVALSVNQRLPELGVRMVFGAKTADVAKTVFVEGLAPVLVGAALGIMGAFFVMKIIPANLIASSAEDPVWIAAMTAGLVVVAATACLGPVWRAVRLDPVQVLRAE